MSDLAELSYTNEAGRPVRKDVNLTLDINQFPGIAVYPWLVMAANQHLTNHEVALWLEHVSTVHPGARRPYGWIKKRRKMTRLSGLSGPRANLDGNDGRAFALMATQRTLSVRDLSAHLKENGITRSREWVRTWRNHR